MHRATPYEATTFRATPYEATTFRATTGLRRLVALVLTCTVLSVSAVVGAPGAWAHGANGQPIPDAAHYLTNLSTITPAVVGVSAKVDPRGEWLSVTNATTQTLTVLGYAREPYLQIDTTGVSENSYSPTLALNQSLFGDLSQLGDSALPPSWRHTGTGREVRWHDHRIHWMGAEKPPVVKAAPAQAHLVGNWNVHLLLGSTPITVSGTLNWLPMKPATSQFLRYFLVADSLALVALVGVGVWLVRRRRSNHREPMTTVTPVG
ncbi:hypothetical protein BH10ACT8_BH10ACT8_15880 [soil metagenome]